MNRSVIIVQNRVINMLLMYNNYDRISQKLSELEGTTEIDGNRIAIMSSPLFKGVFGEPSYAKLAEVINFDAKPSEFRPKLNAFLNVVPINKGNVESAESEKQDKSAYIQIFKDLGYVVVNNDTPVFGKKNQYTEICKKFKDYFLVLNESVSRGTSDGASSNLMLANINVLKEHGISPKRSFFDKEVQAVDEDLRFRVFFKQTELGGELVIKLPRGTILNLDNPVTEKAKAARGEGSRIDYTIFCAEYGKSLLDGYHKVNLVTYLDLDDPCLHIKDIYDNGREYIYECVSFSFISQLAEFAESRHTKKFMEYIKFCGNESCEGFSDSTEDDKVLGNEIVVGSRLKGLEKIALTGKGDQFCAGLLVAGAGSGKTVLLNTLILQAVALNNNPYTYKRSQFGNNGNGAVVLIDNKPGEWTNAWAQNFGDLGRKLYAFDGQRIDSDLLRCINTKGKNKNVVVPIKEPIAMNVAGIYFVTMLRDVIRDIYTQAGVNTTNDFNKGNFNIDGITKLPRTVILVDELTDMAADSKKLAALKGSLFIARDTRTTNMAWLLSGQDLSAKILPNSELANYDYKLLGHLHRDGNNDRYKYYGAKVPKMVEEFESVTEEKFFKQGIFLANNDILKSLFLPESLNKEALNLIHNRYGTQGMEELEQVVEYGIRHKLFTSKRKHTVGVYDKIFVGNNILPAALYQQGLISEAVFHEMTEECLGVEDTQSERSVHPLTELFEQASETENRRDFDFSDTKAKGNHRDSDFSDIKDTRNKVLKVTDKKVYRAEVVDFKVPTTIGEALFLNNRVSPELARDMSIKLKQSMIKPEIGEIANSDKGLFNFLASKSPEYGIRIVKSMWKNILKESGKEIGGVNRITKVELLGNKLFINKRLINLTDIVGGDAYGINEKVAFEDLIDFKILFNMCKSIRELSLDEISFNVFRRDMGEMAYKNAFELSKNLDLISVLYSSGQKRDIHRNMSSKEIKEADKLIDDNETRLKLREKLQDKYNTSTLRGCVNDVCGRIIGHKACATAFKASKNQVRKKGVAHKAASAFWLTTGLTVGALGTAVTIGNWGLKKIFYGLVPKEP